ncbi:hypothetical protein ACXX82_11875 [Glaciimonas sp. GNP009]
MPITFASISESAVAPIFAALGCIPCQTFAPHFRTLFTDMSGYEFKALPDYYHPPTNTFFEYKNGLLNGKKTFKTADNKLRAQYSYRFKQEPPTSHYEVSKRLWDSKYYRVDCLDHSWNHALAKHLAVQLALGVENYVVVFGNNLPEKETLKYDRKGLFFLPLSGLEGFLMI